MKFLAQIWFIGPNMKETINSIGNADTEKYDLVNIALIVVELD